MSDDKNEETNRKHKNEDYPSFGSLVFNGERLRRIEHDVLIPRLMEHKITSELCLAELEKFQECAGREGLKVVWNCRNERKVFEACSNRYMRDEEFRRQCTREYLAKRRQFRDTGKAEPSPYQRLGPRPKKSPPNEKGDQKV